MSGKAAVARETPARRKIREAAERRGLVIAWMDYEPIGAMVEMSGREGGWDVDFTVGTHALGYNANDVVAWIEIGQADPLCGACSWHAVQIGKTCPRCGATQEAEGGAVDG